MSIPSLKVESLIIVSAVICLFLTFYFSYLSFQTTEDTIKKQLTILATFSLIAGMVLLASIAIHFVIKKAFSRMNNQIRTEYDEEEKEGEY